MPLLVRSLSAVFGASLLVACGYGDGDPGSNGRYQPGAADNGGAYDSSCGTLEAAAIDTGQTLDVAPGDGAGVFIEYDAGGTYRITTTCDTGAVGNECWWDVVVTLLDGATLESTSPISLEVDDSLLFGNTDSVRMVAYTDTDFDGFSLQTQPGTAVRFDALLDETCANRYMFWFGDGALHGGAPSNPVDLTPSEP